MSYYHTHISTNKKLQKEMDGVFEKYRLFKYLTADNEYEDNEEIKKYKDYCQQIEKAVNKLPEPERVLIQERYMKDDYISDYKVYYDILMISPPTFGKRRKKAFEKLDMYLSAIKICS